MDKEDKDRWGCFFALVVALGFLWYLFPSIEDEWWDRRGKAAARRARWEWEVEQVRKDGPNAKKWPEATK